MKIFPWQSLRYYKNDLGEWDFLPPELRPAPLTGKYSRLGVMDHEEYIMLGTRFFHDDWFWPFSKIPRTWTSFEFRGAIVECGLPEKFLWKKCSWPKSWFPQKSIIYGPFGFKKIYFCFDFFGYRFRLGPRITDDLENGPGYVYVNYIPIPIIGWLLTFGVKKL